MIIPQYLEERDKLLGVTLIQIELAVLLAVCEMPIIPNYPDCQNDSLYSGRVYITS